MRFHAVSGSAARQRTDCAIVGLYESGVLGAAAAQIDAALGGRLSRLVKQGDVRGKAGEITMLDVDRGPCRRVLVVGLGKKDGLDRRRYKKATLAAAAALIRSGARDAVDYLSVESIGGTDIYYRARLAAEAVGHVLYRVPAIRSSRKPREPALRKIGIAVAERDQKKDAERGLAHGRGIALGAALTRDLANLPANVCTPTYIGQRARELARDYRSVRAQVLGEPELRRLKMGSFLSVTHGTDEPAKLIVVRYQGAAASKAPVVLVGKGVTFDSGGISLKPAPNMAEMKMDMSGAAAVLATLQTAARLKIPLHIVGLVPATENLPGGNALKPGDILRLHNGKTAEIDNTDAEGRLILADALSYATRFHPDVVIDLATLTGACVVALGHHVTGMLGNSEEMMRQLQESGERTYERVWPLPLFEEYEKQIKSDVADVKNVGGRWAGAITAAAFLKNFIGDYRWVHLDIAGTAIMEEAQEYVPKGGSGVGVRLLIDFLRHWKRP